MLEHAHSRKFMMCSCLCDQQLPEDVRQPVKCMFDWAYEANKVANERVNAVGNELANALHVA